MRLEYVWYCLIPAAPAAVVAYFLGAGPLVTFPLAGLGIIPFAAFMGRGTESLAAHIGPRLGGLLNATFGNAAELIIGILALHRGLTSVVKASITGSIIGNALFVMGLSLVVGGLRNGRQRFGRASVGLQSTLLVVASIGMTVPSLLYHTLGERREALLSEEVAAILFGTYLLTLVFTLWGRSADQDRGSQQRREAEEAPEWSLKMAVGILLGATIAVGILAEILVGAIDRAREQGYLEAWGMSEIFVGVVLVAIIGNAAEHSAAVLMAYRNRLELALHIALGSSLQIALLATPILLFASFFLGPQPMDLHFTVMEVMAVCFSVIVVALVAVDGESHWMEGVLMLAVYCILALAFYHLPEVNLAQMGGNARTDSVAR